MTKKKRRHHRSRTHHYFLGVGSGYAGYSPYAVGGPCSCPDCGGTAQSAGDSCGVTGGGDGAAGGSGAAP